MKHKPSKRYKKTLLSLKNSYYRCSYRLEHKIKRPRDFSNFVNPERRDLEDIDLTFPEQLPQDLLRRLHESQASLTSQQAQQDSQCPSEEE